MIISFVFFFNIFLFSTQKQVPQIIVGHGLATYRFKAFLVVIQRT